MYKTRPSDLKGWDYITIGRLKAVISKAIESGETEVRLNRWIFDLDEAKQFLENQ